MPENPEQRYKLESYVTDDDSANERLLNEVYPVSKEGRDYLNKTPEVRAYVDAAQSSNDAENLFNVLGPVTLLAGMAYRAGFRNSGYGLATAAVMGFVTSIAKADASREMKEAAKVLGAPQYAKLLEAGSKSNSGKHIELTAAGLAWSASVPMASLVFGKAGQAADRLVTSLLLGTSGLRHFQSGDTDMAPLRTAVENLARRHKSQS
jgi:hypothetical protein